MSSTQKIAYYGELDPFTGSIQQRMISFARLVRDLKLLCLLHDAVIIPPGNLVEHGLALPAFETLAPFVRAGVLGASDDHVAPGPIQYIEERAETYADEHTRRGPKGLPRPPKPGTGEARMRVDLDEIKSRWGQVLPARWTLTRDVGAQVAGFTERIQQYCAAEPRLPEAGPRLLHIMSRLADAGQPRIARNALLSQVAGLRGDVPPQQLALLTMAIQATYFHLGAAGHERAEGSEPARSCRLFPGRFAWILRHHAASLPPPGVPPYDWKAHPFFVGRRLRQLGLDGDALLGLDAAALFEIARSPEWRLVRARLGELDLPAEEGLSVRALVERYRDLRDALPHLPARLGDDTRPSPALVHPAPVLLPAPWQVSAQAILGARVAGKELTPEPEAREIVLDLRTLLMTDARRGVEAQLTRAEAYLLTLVCSAGDIGFRVHDLKQLLLELDLLQSPASDLQVGPSRARWKAEGRESEGRGASLLDRVHVLKTRTNQVIEPFCLGIDTERRRGRLCLVNLRGVRVSLHIDGALWDLAGLPCSGPMPARLSTQHAKLWSALGASSPHYVSLHTLAGALGCPADEQGLKRAAGALHKLRRAVEQHKLPFRIVRPQRGLYGLLPRPGGGMGREVW